MKISVLGTRGFPGVQGGVEKICEKLYPELVKLGCEVTVFTREPYVNKDISEFKGVRLVPLSCPRSKYIEALWHTFYGVIRARFCGFDILHIHSLGPALCVPLAKLLGMKVVITIHGREYERKKWGGLAKKVLKWGECWGCKHADEVIAIAPYIGDQIRETYGRECHVIPNGVEVEAPAGTTGCISTLGLEPGRYFLSVGRFVPEKAFDELIEAFTGSGEKDWKLVLAGGADHEDEFSRKVRDLAARNANVVLTGVISGGQLREVFSHAGVYVMPSYYEGFPLALLEAMSYGLACVVSDIPAHHVVEFDQSQYFPPGDVGALAEKLKYFKHSTFTPEQSREQVALVKNEFNWRLNAERNLAVYQAVKDGV